MAKSLPTPELRRAVEALLGYDNLNDVRRVTIEIDHDSVPLVTVLRYVTDERALISTVEQLKLDGVAVSTIDEPRPAVPLSDDMIQAIREIPNGTEGWWHAAGHNSFEELAQKLLAKGLTSEETLDVLRRAYGAVASEYGD